MSAEECKEKGNACMKKRDFKGAVEWYTKGIEAEPENCILYSNRSAAYLSKGDADLALADADRSLKIDVSYAKGYARKGAALTKMDRIEDADKVYREALKMFPGEEMFKRGIAELGRIRGQKADEARKPKKRDDPTPEENEEFQRIMADVLMTDPDLKDLREDGEFMHKLSEGANFQGDARFNRLISKVMQHTKGITFQNGKPVLPKKEEKEEEKPKKTELSERQKRVLAVKEEGNAFYKQKKFAEAIERYDYALKLDDACIPVMNNKAACYLEMKDYDKCIEVCREAITRARDTKAPFEDIAKVFLRIGNAYMAQDMYDEAIRAYQQSRMEHTLKGIGEKIRMAEAKKKEQQKKSNFNPELAAKEKEEGNKLFADGKYAEAIKHYSQAIVHEENNAVHYTNKATALSKLMDFKQAGEMVETALSLNPTYVKAWYRKGMIELAMRQYHKSMKSFRKGLELDENDKGCQDGLSKTMRAVENLQFNPLTEQEKQRNMDDPEIRAILADTTMQKVLQDASTDPKSLQDTMMKSPGMTEKINTLFAAGVIGYSTRSPGDR